MRVFKKALFFLIILLTYSSASWSITPAIQDFTVQTETAESPASAPNKGLVSSLEKRVVSFVSKTVETLHYSAYKFGGSHFDLLGRNYIVDCSNFVDHILMTVYPDAYSSLVNATGSTTPASQHFYHFFTGLSVEERDYWNNVSKVAQLKAGDILVFREKKGRGSQGGGHVMVVMDKPARNTDIFSVRVADSAPTGHSQDTRPNHVSGIGIGTLLLKVNPKTGQPYAYAWKRGAGWNHNVNFAMARPTDIS